MPFQNFTTYEFAFDTFNGPLNDSSYKTVYVMLTPTSSFGRKPTTVTRRDGELVGEIQPRTLFKAQKVILNGKEMKDLLEKRREGLLGPSRWYFKDAQGREFYWKELTCYVGNDVPVARYTRQVDRLYSGDVKARLSISDAYVSSLDYLLFSALLMEIKRRDSERALGRQQQPAPEPVRPQRPRQASITIGQLQRPPASSEPDPTTSPRLRRSNSITLAQLARPRENGEGRMVKYAEDVQ